tara:strand:- start:329 stop:1711 length:1383 start_codon:yes stop_codon:yes gene_type:complete
MSNTKSLILSNKKCIDFYEKNPHLDFNEVNELFIDLIQNLSSTSANNNIFCINEMKTLIKDVNKKINNLENNIEKNNQLINMTHSYLQTNKEYYSQEIKNILNNKDNDPVMLQLIREANETWTQKSMSTITELMPKINNNISKEITKLIQDSQDKVINDSTKNIQEFLEKDKSVSSPEMLEKLLKDNYENMSTKLLSGFQPFFNQESTFYKNNVDLRNFLDKQNNSTLKGKISEEKLETCLTQAFPAASITNKSGESKSCDYLMVRKEKSPIMFENKDYSSNVPNEEIKKFIRDVEYKNCDAIMLSQNSGISTKENYQIDIHNGNIMVFIHFVHYDTSKINIAVNLVDHLRNILNKYKNDNNEINISQEDMILINKEYLLFVQQRNELIDNYKKYYKEHLKKLEEFDMHYLTKLLDGLFTNTEQLTFTCKYCNNFTGKNKRALTTHENNCKKKNNHINLN